MMSPDLSFAFLDAVAVQVGAVGALAVVAAVFDVGHALLAPQRHLVAGDGALFQHNVVLVLPADGHDPR